MLVFREILQPYEIWKANTEILIKDILIKLRRKLFGKNLKDIDGLPLLNQSLLRDLNNILLSGFLNYYGTN